MLSIRIDPTAAKAVRQRRLTGKTPYVPTLTTGKSRFASFPAARVISVGRVWVRA